MMNERMQYSRDEIEAILQCSYYDQRTDYVWKYIMGDREELDEVKFPIPGLESFEAMHLMLRRRNRSRAEFLREWNLTGHPELEKYSYDEATDTLLVKARTFTFSYRESLMEYHFEADPTIAESIGLQSNVVHKKLRKGGLFALRYLKELDEQLFSRYDVRQKIKAWRTSPQFGQDIEYCESMLPYIMQDANRRTLQLAGARQLNIILSGNDKVRIGIVEDYSPEEMIAMPCYPRQDWQKGISDAFAALDEQYDRELQEHALQMKEWSEEMSQIALRKAPYDSRLEAAKFHIERHDLGAQAQEEQTLQEKQTALKAQTEQQHQVDKAIAYITGQAAPLVTYTGPSEMIRELYSLQLTVTENGRIKVHVNTSQWGETETFDLENYETKFRVWWSQLLLTECKYAKQCALDPEHNHPLYLHF